MLPPYIIEQIRKRESDAPQPVIQLPLPEPARMPRPPAREPGEADRGVVIIDLV
jgi:hypothetical protein